MIQINTKTKKKIAALAAIFSLLVLIAGTIFITSRPLPDSFLSLTGLPDGTKTTVYWEQAGTAQNLQPSSMEQNKLLFTSPTQKDGSYKLSAALDTDEGYKDIQISFNRSTSQIIIMADGFESGEKLTLADGYREIFSDLSFDWSGKIELSYPLPKNGGGVLCLKTTTNFSLCHLLPDRVRV